MFRDFENFIEVPVDSGLPKRLLEGNRLYTRGVSGLTDAQTRRNEAWFRSKRVKFDSGSIFICI
jgi:hypothetical protein